MNVDLGKLSDNLMSKPASQMDHSCFESIADYSLHTWLVRINRLIMLTAGPHASHKRPSCSMHCQLVASLCPEILHLQ